MLAGDFVQRNPDYFNRALDVRDDWLRIKNQAIEHTRYTPKSRLLSVNRPNEGKDVNTYRNATRRNLTKSSVDKFKTKTSRIFRSSGLTVNDLSLSPALKEYLEGRNYRYLNQPTNLETYFFDCVYSKAIDDPNAVEVLIPVNLTHENISPLAEVADGGVEKNEFIPIAKVIVPSDQILAFTENVFSFQGGFAEVKQSGRPSKMEPWFWIVDREWWYRYMPISMSNEGKIVYELQEWYPHDTGIGTSHLLPVNILPGNLVFDADDEFSYQSSILAAFFEYADEFVNRFSDGQAVWVTSAFPIHVMEEMNCTNEGCLNGQIPNPDTKSETTFIACGTCHGTGNRERPSPFGVLVKKPSQGLDEQKTGKAYELINPDVDTLQTTYNIPFDILSKGEKQIGLDVLENAVESGVAREMRFEDVKDKLADIADKLARYMELHLFFTECLLNADRNQRVVPSVNTPVDFQLKTSIDLRKEAEEAIGTDRHEKTLTYLRNIYKNNESLLKVYEVAFRYSPLTLIPWEEVKDMFDMGVISENDIVKREHAIMIFREISEQANWLTMSDDVAFKMADDLFESKELLNPETMTLLDDNGEPIVPGAEAITDCEVAINAADLISLSTAVASNNMDKSAAVAILVNIYGIESAVASKMISVPKQTALQNGET